MININPSQTRHPASDVKSITPKVARGPNGPRLKAASPEARKLATVILEVMAGARLPSDAAKALDVTVGYYYRLECRALNGLLAACEPMGTTRSVENQLITAQKEVRRLQQECARYSTLVRATQRTVGLAPRRPVKSNESGNGKRGLKQKPTVRALQAAQLLINSPLSGETEASSAGEHLAKG
jgi:hypothetical protein